VPLILLATLGYLLPWGIATMTADLLVDVAAVILHPLWAGLAFTADLPGAVVDTDPGPTVVVVASLALMLVLLPLGLRIRSAAMLVVVWSLIAARPAPSRHDLEIEVLEAGSGSTVLLRTPHHSLLAGSAESFGSRGRGFTSRLRPQLAARLASNPDAWVLGRADPDRLASVLAARAGAPAMRVFAVAAPGRQLPPELASCGPRAWEWDGVDFDLMPAASGRGCLLRVATDTYRMLLLVDGDAADRGRLTALAGPEPDLRLLLAMARTSGAARGYRLSGAGVDGAKLVVIDGDLLRPMSGLSRWQRLTRAPPTPRCAVPT
jgi:competence protein ComEC